MYDRSDSRDDDAGGGADYDDRPADNASCHQRTICERYEEDDGIGKHPGHGFHHGGVVAIVLPQSHFWRDDYSRGWCCLFVERGCTAFTKSHSWRSPLCLAIVAMLTIDAKGSGLNKKEGLNLQNKMQTILFSDRDLVPVRAMLLGQSLDLKPLEQIDFLAKDPLAIAAGESGCAILFRSGVVVLYALSPLEEATFITNLKEFTIGSFASPEAENVKIHRDANSTGTVEGDIIFLPEFDLKSLQIVATILAKSVIMAYYEINIASAFERIEPFANRLQHARWSKQQVRELLKQLGNALAVEHKMVGRVQVIDKPKLLWESSELDRFYLRLEKEFEIQARQLVLERKLALVYRTVETSLGLLQHNTNLRVEWYIVILIVVEIFLSLYEMFFNR